MQQRAATVALGTSARDFVRPLQAHLGSHRVLLAIAIVPAALVIAFSQGRVHTEPIARWLLVTLPAVIVTITTLTTLYGARRHPDTRSSLMAIAFLVMALILIARSLAMGPELLWSPGLARLTDMLVLPLGALVLALSVAPELRQRRRLDVVRQSVPAVGLVVAAALAFGFSVREQVPAVPRAGSDIALLVFAVGAALLFVLARRAARTAVLTGRGGDLFVAVGAMSAICAFWGITHAFRNDVLWWTAHGLELFALAAMCIPAARDLRRHTASRPLVGDLRAADIVADAESFLDGRVHHLLIQLGHKDDVTEGHTRRVATLAVRMGEQLGLDATSLRDLAAGGLLHDIGKLKTPDVILKKPSKLTDAEYEVIKRHPADGRRILNGVGRFNERVLHLVDAHHERLDGGGYPAGRSAQQIQLEARILAVADVYDALTSHRPYRVAWPADRALEVIQRDAGLGFDARCVEALRAVVRPPRVFVSRRVRQPRTARTLVGRRH